MKLWNSQVESRVLENSSKQSGLWLALQFPCTQNTKWLGKCRWWLRHQWIITSAMMSSVKDFRWSNYFALNRIEPACHWCWSHEISTTPSSMYHENTCNFTFTSTPSAASPSDPPKHFLFLLLPSLLILLLFRTLCLYLLTLLRRGYVCLCVLLCAGSVRCYCAGLRLLDFVYNIVQCACVTQNNFPLFRATFSFLYSWFYFYILFKHFSLTRNPG